MTEPRILAIADTPVPPDVRREMMAAKAKAKRAAKPAPKRSLTSGAAAFSHSATSSGSTTHQPKEPPTPPGRGGGKTFGGKGPWRRLVEDADDGNFRMTSA